MEDVDFEKLTHLPFQTQITFTSLEGDKCIRVISAQLAISSERDTVEQNANFQILGQHAL